MKQHRLLFQFSFYSNRLSHIPILRVSIIPVNKTAYSRYFCYRCWRGQLSLRQLSRKHLKTCSITSILQSALSFLNNLLMWVLTVEMVIFKSNAILLSELSAKSSLIICDSRFDKERAFAISPHSTSENISVLFAIILFSLRLVLYQCNNQIRNWQA